MHDGLSPLPDDMGRESERYVVGRILGPHGLRGDVKVLCMAADPAVLFKKSGVFTAKTGTDTLKLTRKSQQKPDVFIASVSGITDCDQAKTLKSTQLYAPREALPPLDPETDGYYVADLLGLAVKAPDGRLIGTVMAIENFGASDVIDIAGPDGTHFLLPFSPPFLLNVDLTAGVITMDAGEAV